MSGLLDLAWDLTVWGLMLAAVVAGVRAIARAVRRVRR